jgi:hypothetical protein
MLPLAWCALPPDDGPVHGVMSQEAVCDGQALGRSSVGCTYRIWWRTFDSWPPEDLEVEDSSESTCGYP